MDEITLKNELKNLIVSELNLLDENGSPLDPDSIGDEMPFFSSEEGLNLDSVDALTLIPVINEKYGVEIEDEEQGQEAFQNINSLAGFILSRI